MQLKNHCSIVALHQYIIDQKDYSVIPG